MTKKGQNVSMKIGFFWDYTTTFSRETLRMYQLHAKIAKIG